MGLIKHDCFTANCDVCRKEFETEIDGIETVYFLSKIELEDAFHDEDWSVENEKYICNKCNGE